MSRRGRLALVEDLAEDAEEDLARFGGAVVPLVRGERAEVQVVTKTRSVITEEDRRRGFPFGTEEGRDRERKQRKKNTCRLNKLSL